jgi:hypothetical protein
MIRNGVEGAETCAEVFEPHYFNSFHFNAMKRLEAAIMSNPSVDEIGQALVGYYRMSDIAGPYLEFERAPQEVKDLDLCMRDAAESLIRKAGVDPEIFIVSPQVH